MTGDQQVEHPRGAHRQPGGRLHLRRRPRRQPRTESPLGDLIADAQLAATTALDRRSADRADEPGRCPGRPHLRGQAGGEGDGVVTYAEGFTVQPFANTRDQDFTGAQIQVLKEQVTPADRRARRSDPQRLHRLDYTLDEERRRRSVDPTRSS